jgi:hypothetical protein
VAKKTPETKPAPFMRLTSEADKPSDTPMAKRREAIDRFIAELHKEYMPLDLEASVQVEHTATAGWQALVGSFRQAQQTACIELSKKLTAASELIVQHGPSEGMVKSISDIKKEMEVVFETGSYFDQSVVTPIRNAAMRAQQLMEKKKAEAKRMDSNEPLIWSGLEDAVNAACRKLNRYGWNHAKWCVEKASD